MKKFLNSKYSKFVHIFSLASMVIEFLAILRFFTKKYYLQNISGNHAATWQQKLAAYFPSLNMVKMFPGKR
jgi:hypothetical protein